MTTLDYYCVKLSPLGAPALIVVATSTTNRNVWAEAHICMPGAPDDKHIGFHVASRAGHDEATVAACTLKVALIRLKQALGKDAADALQWTEPAAKGRDEFAQWVWTGEYGMQATQILFDTECDELREDVKAIVELRPVVVTG